MAAGPPSSATDPRSTPFGVPSAFWRACADACPTHARPDAAVLSAAAFTSATAKTALHDAAAADERRSLTPRMAPIPVPFRFDAKQDAKPVLARFIRPAFERRQCWRPSQDALRARHAYAAAYGCVSGPTAVALRRAVAARISATAAWTPAERAPATTRLLKPRAHRRWDVQAFLRQCRGGIVARWLGSSVGSSERPGAALYKKSTASLHATEMAESHATA